MLLLEVTLGYASDTKFYLRHDAENDSFSLLAMTPGKVSAEYSRRLQQEPPTEATVFANTAEAFDELMELAVTTVTHRYRRRQEFIEAMTDKLFGVMHVEITKVLQTRDDLVDCQIVLYQREWATSELWRDRIAAVRVLII